MTEAWPPTDASEANDPTEQPAWGQQHDAPRDEQPEAPWGQTQPETSWNAPQQPPQDQPQPDAPWHQQPETPWGPPSGEAPPSGADSLWREPQDEPANPSRKAKKRSRGSKSKRKGRQDDSEPEPSAHFAEPAPALKPGLADRFAGLFAVLRRRPSAGSPPTSIRSARITVIDGPALITVQVRNGAVVSIERDDFASEQVAVAHAGRRGGDIVWAGSGLRSIRFPAEEGSTRSQRFMDAARAETSFEGATEMVRTGRLLFGLPDEIAGPLLRRCRIHFSACSLDKRSGYWLRLGEEHSEMTMVKEGEIVEWSQMREHGTNRVQRLKDAGREITEVLHEQTAELASWVAHSRNQWLLRETSEGTVHFHGAGEGWAGLETVVREASGCRVVAARVIEASGPHKGHATTAVLGLLSPRAHSSRSVLRSERYKAKVRKWLPAIVGALAVAVIVALSIQQSNAVHAREDAAAERLGNAWMLEPDANAKPLAERALQIQTVNDELLAHNDGDGYLWENVFSEEMRQRRRVDDEATHFEITLKRCALVTWILNVHGFEEVESAKFIAAAQAELVFGEGASAVSLDSPDSHTFDDDGNTDVRYELRPPEEACPSES